VGDCIARLVLSAVTALSRKSCDCHFCQNPPADTAVRASWIRQNKSHRGSARPGVHSHVQSATTGSGTTSPSRRACRRSSSWSVEVNSPRHLHARRSRPRHDRIHTRFSNRDEQRRCASLRTSQFVRGFVMRRCARDSALSRCARSRLRSRRRSVPVPARASRSTS